MHQRDIRWSKLEQEYERWNFSDGWYLVIYVLQPFVTSPNNQRWTESFKVGNNKTKKVLLRSVFNAVIYRLGGGVPTFSFTFL